MPGQSDKSMDEKKKKFICPRCGKETGVPIVYGTPSDEVMEDPDLIFGGCIISEGAHTHGCTACGHWWGGTDTQWPELDD